MKTDRTHLIRTCEGLPKVFHCTSTPISSSVLKTSPQRSFILAAQVRTLFWFPVHDATASMACHFSVLCNASNLSSAVVPSVWFLTQQLVNRGSQNFRGCRRMWRCDTRSGDLQQYFDCSTLLEDSSCRSETDSKCTKK